MKRRVKRLRLHRETLRNLDNSHVRGAHGGGTVACGTDATGCGPCYTTDVTDCPTCNFTTTTTTSVDTNCSYCNC